MTNEEILENCKKQRIGLEKLNKQGCLMRLVEYNNSHDIVIEFIDDYHAKIHTKYDNFKKGNARNPYAPTVYNRGISGSKYKTHINRIPTKEYQSWRNIMQRCFDDKYKSEHPAYQDVTCCDEWLLYENFYEWAHNQENFEKWFRGDRWAVDKDILVKGNKVYSSDTCCLVPIYLNTLFVKNNVRRGDLPIGVTYKKDMEIYRATISMIKNKRPYQLTTGRYPTPEDAFYLGYKPYKEKYIKKIAQEEYELGNITKKCYEAMMNYQVEITD